MFNKIKTKIDTVESRTKIGFPDKQEWLAAAATYTRNSLKIAGHPIMESWEGGYMKKLASIATSGGGTILEVGYGMGISAKAILKSPNTSQHFIIECHPDVIRKALDDIRESLNTRRAHILGGFWEELTPLMRNESFDGILFDTYPLTKEEVHANHFWFFEEAYRLLKPGGVLTYYSDEACDFSKPHRTKLEKAGFSDITYEICQVNPPEDCEYWQDTTIIAPIVRKS